MNKTFVNGFRIFLVTFLMFFLSACATTGAIDERDPWEGFNRGVYSFNEGMDTILFDPIGKAYNFIMPDILDNGVSNFFSNVAQVPVIANDILQFKFGQAVNDTLRLVVNSTLGLLGFFDVSTDLGLPSSKADFGQTLAYWGVDSGPYLVIPFFGPATVRHAIGYAADAALNPMFYIEDDLTKAGLLSLNFVDVKSDLLSATDLIGEAALDEYEFIKNAYFEKRNSKINGEEFAAYPEE